MTKIIFAMYNPETDCVEVSLNENIRISFNCKKCNASVRLNEPSDIAYLTRLARDGGLQGYVEAMGSLIRTSLIQIKISKIINILYYQLSTLAIHTSNFFDVLHVVFLILIC